MAWRRSRSGSPRGVQSSVNKTLHVVVGYVRRVGQARVGLIDRSGSLRLTRVSFNRDFFFGKAFCPCSRRYAELSNFKIAITHPWNWNIGSSTSAAPRSFDMVVSHRRVRLSC